MTTYRYKRIAVKVGSNVLTGKQGGLDIKRLASLVDQVSTLQKAGIEVILVSSGAVASGRSVIQPNRKLDPVDQRQLYSAVGQAILMQPFTTTCSRKTDLCAARCLPPRKNFHSRRHYLNQKICMTVMLENGVVPVVNENDTISVTELMFTDNDELSGLIATMMDVEALIILEQRRWHLQRQSERSGIQTDSCH